MSSGAETHSEVVGWCLKKYLIGDESLRLAALLCRIECKHANVMKLNKSLHIRRYLIRDAQIYIYVISMDPCFSHIAVGSVLVS